jgi:hypothetical protein
MHGREQEEVSLAVLGSKVKSWDCILSMIEIYQTVLSRE